jgi:hypothetical protein
MIVLIGSFVKPPFWAGRGRAAMARTNRRRPMRFLRISRWLFFLPAQEAAGAEEK